ncbi:Stp1/IreP family PP2C-type Ser/Thr phosphatase [Arsenicicoccus sp. oral taxon 190]|uniref:Stp1/IreP family PP2C-type Ser/Thr phosphatase n=1 Tax=Arsenicicoccus sp. oral taxon 190 TaxID=1658671 RepID=UPI00209E9FD6|nr:Stp1/IreP family PP2C-type Ser/Thr phosphatase [Arsenicicoccus sp. oral taxon 190]
MALRYAARSHVGLVRDSNQDSAYAGPHLLVVADGMGGHAGGDVASSTAIGALAHLDDDSHGTRALQHLEDAVANANAQLHDITQEQPELHGMGTTVTALLRADNKLAVAHIGDSRAYLLRGGTLTQLTHDHTFVQSLVDEGRIEPEEAEHHPQRSMVTRVLTGQDGDEPDVSWRELRHGDRYLICSDGVSGFVAHDTIAEILAEVTDPGRAADRLVDLALRSGGQDNITAIVADVVRLADEAAPSTRPQVVGAAAARQLNRSAPDTPASRAAALARTASGAGDQEPVALAEEGVGSRWGRLARILAASLLTLLVLVGIGYAAWRWTQQQYFVTDRDGRVTIYRGLDQTLGPIELSSVAEQTDVPVADLPDFYRTRVQTGVTAGSLDSARGIVTDLRTQAQACANAKAHGQACGGPGAGTPATTPTSTVPAATVTTTSGPRPRPTPPTTPTTGATP